jgi:hypothetical protein
MNYRFDFARVCLEEIHDNFEAQIRYNSLSTRLAKLENDEFLKFMESNTDEKASKEKRIVDHSQNLRDLES